MPRYTDSPQDTRTIVQPFAAVGTAGNDLETPICRAPFDGYLSAARIAALAAYTGAATNYRSWRVRNKFTTGNLGGVAIMAQLDGVNGTNLTAFTWTTVPLAATVPAAAAYLTQPTTTPSVAPVLSQGTGSLTAGQYAVAYTYTVNGVESDYSPVSVITQDGSHGIAVAAIGLPPGVSGSAAVKYYFLVSPGTAGLVTTGSGAAVTLNAQGNAALPARYSAMDVTAGDSIVLQSLHVGTGLADPGGTLELVFTRS